MLAYLGNSHSNSNRAIFIFLTSLNTWYASGEIESSHYYVKTSRQQLPVRTIGHPVLILLFFTEGSLGTIINVKIDYPLILP